MTFDLMHNCGYVAWVSILLIKSSDQSERRTDIFPSLSVAGTQILYGTLKWIAGTRGQCNGLGWMKPSSRALAGPDAMVMDDKYSNGCLGNQLLILPHKV